MNSKNNKKFNNNYFLHIINKYNLKITKNNPIVIFLDGKGVTSSNFFNLLSEDNESFNEYFEKTIKHFCNKYNCLAIFGIDEVSFVFENPKNIQCKEIFKNTKSQDIVSIFSQKFYESILKISNKKYKIYWHCKISNIPRGKIKSYIKYRSNTIQELFITYFLKRMNVINAGKIKLSQKIEIARKYKSYNLVNKFQNGHLCINGELVDLEEYINFNKIEILPETKRNTLNLNLENF